MAPPSAPASVRLSELAAQAPGDRTLKNLLGLVNAKLDVCAQLPIFEYEAQHEGHTASAAMFHELAEQERRSFANLLACVRLHLDQQALNAPGCRGS